MQHMNLAQRRQAQWDTIMLIVDRCLDVTILLLSIFAFIYICNGNYFTAITLLVINAICIVFNRDTRFFHSIHMHISRWHQNYIKGLGIHSSREKHTHE